MSPPTQAPPELLKTLQQPSPASCRAEPVDFASLGFSEHEDAFAVLIHDLLTPEECDALRYAAEATTSGPELLHDQISPEERETLRDATKGKTSGVWAPALINGGDPDRQVLNTEMRLCDRILWDDQVVADALLERIRPHLPADILRLERKPQITGVDPVWAAATWRATRLNERLRFLRYQPGMYFRPHYDGFFVTPDGSEVSFLTIHLYLRGSDDLEGGATRFFAMDVPGHIVTHDVDPAPGACLVFQHHDLEHSGDDVKRGTKYTVRTDLMYERIWKYETSEKAEKPAEG